MFDGFVRLCAATPALEVANVEKNAAEIAYLALEAAAQGANVCVFPELCLTGYTCGDLFLHDRLVRGALEGLKVVLDKTREVDMLMIVGLPVADGNCLYNCAAVLQGGHVLGVVPKTHLPNYAEFYELRQFAPAFEGRRALHWFGEEVPFAANLLFACRELPEFVVGVEICEDLWAPLPTGVRLALAGATVLLNPSASDALAGKRDYRRELVSSQSARLAAAYVYAGAGPDESTQDVVFAGHSLIYEYGSKLAESEPFAEGLLFADADVGFLALERRANNDFREGAGGVCETVSFSQPLRALELRRFIDPAPFIPHDPDHLSERAEELLSIQAHGLARRLRHTHAQKLVLGVSGGLDSTLALLVCVRALKLAGLDASHLTAVTMPCFGTTQRTRSNAEIMAREVGADFRVIDIQKATLQHMSDIGLSVEDRSTAYENAQAPRAHAGINGHRQRRKRPGGGHGRPFRERAGLGHLQRRPHEHVWRQLLHPQDAHPPPRCLRGLACRHARASKGAAGRAGHARQSRTSAAQGRRDRPEDRGSRRPLPPARFLPLPHAAPPCRAGEDFAPCQNCLCRRVRRGNHPQVADGVHAAILPAAVQAQLHPGRPQGGQRVPLATRRLAHAHGRGLATVAAFG